MTDLAVIESRAPTLTASQVKAQVQLVQQVMKEVMKEGDTAQQQQAQTMLPCSFQNTWCFRNPKRGRALLRSRLSSSRSFVVFMGRFPFAPGPVPGTSTVSSFRGRMGRQFGRQLTA